MVNGFLPCGLVYAALSLPVALSAPLPGALAMLAFGAGTVPLLSTVALGLRRSTPASLAARRMLAMLVLAVGLWSIGVRSGILPGGEHGAAPGHHGPH